MDEKYHLVVDGDTTYDFSTIKELEDAIIEMLEDTNIEDMQAFKGILLEISEGRSVKITEKK